MVWRAWTGTLFKDGTRVSMDSFSPDLTSRRSFELGWSVLGYASFDGGAMGIWGWLVGEIVIYWVEWGDSASL